MKLYIFLLSDWSCVIFIVVYPLSSPYNNMKYKKKYSSVKPQTSNKLSIYNIMDVKVQVSNACEIIY